MCPGQSTTQPAALAARDVDAPLPHLLREGDFFPMEMEVEVKQEKKS